MDYDSIWWVHDWPNLGLPFSLSKRSFSSWRQHWSRFIGGTYRISGLCLYGCVRGYTTQNMAWNMVLTYLHVCLGSWNSKLITIASQGSNSHPSSATNSAVLSISFFRTSRVWLIWIHRAHEQAQPMSAKLHWCELLDFVSTKQTIPLIFNTHDWSPIEKIIIAHTRSTTKAG